MDKANSYRGLKFARTQWRVPPRLVVLAITAMLFGLMWWLIPQEILFFFLLAIFLTLVWLASYSWRTAVAVLRRWLGRLEQLS